MSLKSQWVRPDGLVSPQIGSAQKRCAALIDPILFALFLSSTSLCNVSRDVIDSKSAGATLRSPASSCTTSDLDDVTPLIDCVSRHGGHSFAMRRARPPLRLLQNTDC
ncbi:hypothetical protein C8R47DRAFT_1320696 [Mycena vitilis]|nr:hypothetical protein C8R47DRAFT_1320696 [Mycena vitilis]